MWSNDDVFYKVIDSKLIQELVKNNKIKLIDFLDFNNSFVYQDSEENYYVTPSNSNYNSLVIYSKDKYLEYVRLKSFPSNDKLWEYSLGAEFRNEVKFNLFIKESIDQICQLLLIDNLEQFTIEEIITRYNLLSKAIRSKSRIAFTFALGERIRREVNGKWYLQIESDALNPYYHAVIFGNKNEHIDVVKLVKETLSKPMDFKFNLKLISMISYEVIPSHLFIKMEIS
ncbi:MAG: hypothetical protein J0L69_10065 [Bacteroidetes bacterium]|nr:hypothetical protein [Bacteroidota bacterium]